MIRGLAYLLASYKSNRVDNDSYVFSFKKFLNFGIGNPFRRMNLYQKQDLMI